MNNILLKEYINQKIYIDKLVQQKKSRGAILFYGEAEAPKLDMALYLIEGLNSIKDSNFEDSTTSVEKFKKLNHPDLHILLPLPNKKIKENEAHELWKKAVLKNTLLSYEDWQEILNKEFKAKNESIISSERINGLVNKLRLKNYEASKRIVLIWCAEKLNLQASNKLLKTLEEPPKHTCFLFISENKDQLIKTISSRLEKLYVPKISRDLKKKYVQFSQNKYSEFQLETNSIYQLNNFDLSLMDSQNFEILKKWMRACHKKNVIELNDIVIKHIASSKKELMDLLKYTLKKLSFCVRKKIGINKKLFNNEESSFFNNFCEHLKTESIILLIEKVDQNIYFLKRNANSKLLFLSLSFEFFKIFDENKV